MAGCRALTKKEVAEVLQCLATTSMPDRNCALFALGISTGFRISELLSLSVSNVINPSNKEIANYISVHRRNMKRKQSSRTMPINTTAKKYLIKQLNEYHSRGIRLDAPLFAQKWKLKKLSTSHACHILRRAFLACNITPAGSHTMRKTFASRFYTMIKQISDDDPLLQTQVALGHKSVDSTSRYLKTEQANVFKAVMMLGDYD